MKKITLLFITLSIFVCSYATGGYAIMRVIDCTRGAAMGKEFLDPQILITYETGESEVIELATYSEKEEPEQPKNCSIYPQHYASKRLYACGYIYHWHTGQSRLGICVFEALIFRLVVNLALPFLCFQIEN
jgi:hypothetical protein